ncbi:MAG: alpha/beta hydrolase [Candidatus Hodarchaeales archaeon]
MTIKYMKGAEPLFIKGSKTGCLLLHGAGGGTTWDLKEFASILHAKTGTTIWLPALKGFGTQPEDLYEVTFSDWLNDARNGMKKLQQYCEQVFIVGHSMGGLLTLLLASENRNISAIVTWAAAFGVKSRLLTFLPIIDKIPIIRGVIPKKFTMSVSEELIKQGWIGYEWLPPSLGFIILEGFNALKKSLNQVICPTFIIQGSEDEAITKNSAKKIYQGIQSSVKEMWIVEGAHHPLMNEPRYKEELFARTIAFLENAQI